MLQPLMEGKGGHHLKNESMEYVQMGGGQPQIQTFISFL